MARRIEGNLDDERFRYPWKQWLDGSQWFAVRGEDYHCTTPSFRAALYDHARKNGIRVRTAREGDGVRFQFASASGQLPGETPEAYRRRLAQAS